MCIAFHRHDGGVLCGCLLYTSFADGSFRRNRPVQFSDLYVAPKKGDYLLKRAVRSGLRFYTAFSGKHEPAAISHICGETGELSFVQQDDMGQNQHWICLLYTSRCV